MYICNTGLECEDCIGGCEQNLEWEDEDELTFLLLPIRNFEVYTAQEEGHK